MYFLFNIIKSLLKNYLMKNFLENSFLFSFQKFKARRKLWKLKAQNENAFQFNQNSKQNQ